MDGYTWFSAVCSGANNVILQQKKLNKINVFPVADGDTGNNLAALMQSILAYTKPEASFYQTAHSIAQASLTGAKGNSGTIFAQFFQGLIPAVGKEDISAIELVDQISKATQKAQDAVMNPVLGTILTVMQDWGKTCQSLKQKVLNCKDLFLTSLEPAKKSLESTKQYLEVLKKADVVDAGAQGFVYFLEGICNYFNNPKSYKDILNDLKFNQIEVDLELEEHFCDTYPNERYCSEFLLADLKVDLTTLKQKLNVFGDSIVAAGSEEKAKLHLHTNQPAQVVEVLMQMGKVLSQKAEDMLRQYQMTQKQTASIALVMDSSADIPTSFIDEYQIHVLPFNVHVGKDEYLDRLTINSDKIYTQMRQKDDKILTALPNNKLVESALMQIKNNYAHAIVINIASLQSGTFQLFVKTAERLDLKNIAVIDSKLNSVGHGLLVFEAAKCIEKGMEFQEIVNYLEKLKTKIKVFAAPFDIKYMVRSGRVSSKKARIINFLGIKPLVSIDEHGKGIIWKKAFGFPAGLEKMIDLVKKDRAQITAYAINHADAEKTAQDFAKKIEAILGFPPLYITSVSSAIGVHAGPGTVGLGLMYK